MIKISKKSGLIIKGESLTVTAELSAIIHSMLVDEVLPKKEIEKAIAIAFMSANEIDKKFNQIIENKQADKEIKQILKQILDNLEEIN